MKVICAYCHAFIREKDGKGVEGVSHGICGVCEARLGEMYFQGYTLPEPKPTPYDVRGAVQTKPQYDEPPKETLESLPSRAQHNEHEPKRHE